MLREKFNESKKYVSLNKTKLLIDKHPFHLVEAGIIHRIFPTAKFIFVIRHPFDVVLSCFMQCFEINEGTAHFFNLDDASRLYQEIIDLWYQYQELLPLETCQLYYEDLIGSFEDSVQNLMTFLNIPWDDSVKRYFEHQHYQKSDRKTYTASYSQVSQPIYQTAKYRWRNYRSFLEPVIPKLAPFAQKFGYPIE
ncbi:MAG: sulfotransferase [Leptolyngbyaceae bacterium]|nr:sulfotransferase [Leptolyngbyaceae bacterium]